MVAKIPARPHISDDILNIPIDIIHMIERGIVVRFYDGHLCRTKILAYYCYLIQEYIKILGEYTVEAEGCGSGPSLNLYFY